MASLAHSARNTSHCPPAANPDNMDSQVACVPLCDAPRRLRRLLRHGGRRSSRQLPFQFDDNRQATRFDRHDLKNGQYNHQRTAMHRSGRHMGPLRGASTCQSEGLLEVLRLVPPN